MKGLTQYSCAIPLHSSTGFFAVMMVDEVIRILVIKLLFSCEHSHNPSSLKGKSETRSKKQKHLSITFILNVLLPDKTFP
jgi:hypothetical protein